MFVKDFGVVRTEKLTLGGSAVPAASEYTKTHQFSGRIALEVNNVEGGGTVYVGGADVTEENGVPVKAGEYRVFPVQPTGTVYVTGSGEVRIAEYF